MAEPIADPVTDNPAAVDDQGGGSGSFLTGLVDSGDKTATSPEDQAPALPDKVADTTTEKKVGATEGEKSTPELPGWSAAATKALKADPRFIAYASKFKSFDDAVKSALDLEQKMGTMVAIPGKDASDEERTAFLLKRGVPEKPEGYVLPKDAKVYNKAQEQDFRELAHKLHLDQDDALALYEQTTAAIKATAEGLLKQRAEAKTQCDGVLRKEWGAKYDEYRETMRRGLARFGSKQLADYLDKSGAGNQPEIVKLFYELGRISKEDTAPAGRPGAGTKSTADIMYPKG